MRKLSLLICILILTAPLLRGQSVSGRISNGYARSSHTAGSMTSGVNNYYRLTDVNLLEKDSLILVSFYQNTNGTGWTDNSGWLSEPLVNWKGIEIQKGRVSAIRLDSNTIAGEVPAEFAKLDGLTQVGLAGNAITQVPDLRNLRLIQELRLENNQLSFEDLEPNSDLTGISYAPQAILKAVALHEVAVGQPFTLEISGQGTTDVYHWYHDSLKLENQTSSLLNIASVDRSTMGDYYVEVTNPQVPGLTLKSEGQRLEALATISGTLENPDFLVDKGKVLLLQTRANGTYDTVAVQTLNANSFSFSDVYLRDYLILSEPDTSAYESLLATYYGNALFWDEADTLKLSANTEGLVIDVQQLVQESSGTAKIEGTFTNEEQINGRTTNNTRIEGAKITLLKEVEAEGSTDEPGFSMIAFTYTDEDGFFSFQNLEKASYKLKIDYPGVSMNEAYDIAIDLTAPTIDSRQVEAKIVNNQIQVEDITVLSVGNELAVETQMFPNPASEQVQLRLPASAGFEQLSLLDVRGNPLKEYRIQGENRLSLNLQDLDAGLYILRLKGKKTMYLRLLKE